MGCEQVGSEDRAASPMHRRCGSMWSQIFSTPMAPIHRRRRRRTTETLAMHRPCVTILRPPLLRPHLGDLY
eukprot:2536176-Pyramimonas_sp.AAC.1